MEITVTLLKCLCVCFSVLEYIDK